ncbi:UDP-4-amino-4,6-dideoxy-N-acetyl-beta-L-altrosamine transaminase [Neptuniibacter sp. QD34_54]|uniref:UDP-4-amino-4, 6-dideoxy-N-acetyl-beta-L-altrosamine transaminase n=1 Tax=Neptuniibacter sp. QD34_54 TaxID=3398208 RepID=UPI0039F5D29F
MIPYGKQDINQDDIDSVIEVLQSDFLTQGPKVPAFEEAVCKYTSANYGVAVNSATSALHIACLSLDLKEGGVLWTTPISFVASANCGLYCGADIDFVDIDPETYNISVTALEDKLKQAQIDNCLPNILVAVHLCGQSCDMEAIRRLSREYGFYVIEDASHAIGGEYQGKKIGSCEYSDITIFSFHPVKIITTAEGGIATTNDKYLADQMRLFSSHGVTRDPELMTKETEGPWYYQQICLGYNYRMTELQAALGISQLVRLDEFVARRHYLAEKYDSLLKGMALDTPKQNSSCYSSFHLYIIRLRLVDIPNKTHREIFQYLRDRGIGVNLHYIPIYTQPYYEQQYSCKIGVYPEADRYYEEAISLPLYPKMSEEDQLSVVSALAKAIEV